MNSSVKDQLLTWIQLWDASSEHRTGTFGDRATSEWLMREIQALSATPVLDQFPFTRRIPRENSISIDGRTVQGIPMFDATATDESGTSAELCSDPEGNGIYVLGAQSTGQTNNEAALATLRRTQGLDGIVVVSRTSKPGLALINADEFKNPFGHPVLQISSVESDWILDAAHNRRSATLTVTFDEEDTTATNVQTRIPGKYSELAPLVVMTPKSAWYTCTAERIGGIVIWLECIRRFVEEQPDRDVVFTANTGHELGHVGLEHFLERNPRLAMTAHCWIHLGANFAARDCRIRTQGSNREILSKLVDSFHRNDVQIEHIVKPGTRPGGEARNIFDLGGNYVSLLGSNGLFHHPEDRFHNNVDLDRLMHIRDAMLEVAQSLAASA